MLFLVLTSIRMLRSAPTRIVIKLNVMGRTLRWWAVVVIFGFQILEPRTIGAFASVNTAQ